MKLVITYSVGDGYEYSGTSSDPVEYESAEALAVNLEAHVKAWLKARDANSRAWCPGSKDRDEWRRKNIEATSALAATNRFPGTNLCASWFTDYEGEWEEPTIQTLDEWFIAGSTLEDENWSG